MKSLKGRGGVIGKGMTDNVMNVWTKTMHRCAELSDALNELVYTQRSPEKHKEMSVARIARDSVDYQDILSWFESQQSI